MLVTVATGSPRPTRGRSLPDGRLKYSEFPQLE